MPRNANCGRGKNLFRGERENLEAEGLEDLLGMLWNRIQAEPLL